MSVVSELGYLGLGVTNPVAWRDYATRILGMEAFDEDEPDRFYLRMDLWHHRFVIHSGGDDDLAYIGWRVAGPREFEEIRLKLEQAGVVVRVAAKAEAEERRVLGLLKLEDPAGNPTEIFYSPQVDVHKPFHPGRPLFGKFSTGAQGMGHCILRQPDGVAAFRFYSLLGFTGAMEYRLRAPDGSPILGTFMHCNDRQHTIAWFSDFPKRIDHFMFEYETLDDLGQTYDLTRKAQIPIAAQLGKHANDQSLSFYMQNPSGFLFEAGWAGRRAPPQEEHYISDIFGHDLEQGHLMGNIKLRVD